MLSNIKQLNLTKTLAILNNQLVIVDKCVKRLCSKEVAWVTVAWQKLNGEEMTWES
jgi:hypothetical protein